MATSEFQVTPLTTGEEGKKVYENSPSNEKESVDEVSLDIKDLCNIGTSWNERVENV